VTQWDTHVLWEGRSRSRRPASYRVTRDAVHFEMGEGDGATRDLVPLWVVTGVVVGRSALQRMRGVGDVTLQLDREARPLQPVATISNVADPDAVRDVIVEQADRVRRMALTREPEPADTGIDERPEPARAALPITQELRELAALRDAEVITEEEFQQLKARLLEG
jgi:hypothetical protein